jgi:hypothetical protein
MLCMTNSNLLHCHVDSGIVFHGCPPFLGAWGQLTPAPGSSSVGRLTFTPCSERGPLLHLARPSPRTLSDFLQHIKTDDAFGICYDWPRRPSRMIRSRSRLSGGQTAARS